MICLNRPYHFKFCKGCLPNILLCPFLNILPHLQLHKRDCRGLLEITCYRHLFLEETPHSANSYKDNSNF